MQSYANSLRKKREVNHNFTVHTKECYKVAVTIKYYWISPFVFDMWEILCSALWISAPNNISHINVRGITRKHYNSQKKRPIWFAYFVLASADVKLSVTSVADIVNSLSSVGKISIEFVVESFSIITKLLSIGRKGEDSPTIISSPEPEPNDRFILPGGRLNTKRNKCFFQINILEAT